MEYQNKNHASDVVSDHPLSRAETALYRKSKTNEIESSRGHNIRDISRLESPVLLNPALFASPSIANIPIVLPPEPGLDDGPTVLCKFRIPGCNLTRRFLKNNSIADIFSYLRYQCIEGKLDALASLCEGDKIIQLSTRFPTRVISEKDVIVSDGTIISDFEISSQIDFFVGSVNS